MESWAIFTTGKNIGKINISQNFRPLSYFTCIVPNTVVHIESLEGFLFPQKSPTPIKVRGFSEVSLLTL